MSDLLGRPEWQGIGVLVTLVIAAATWWQARRSQQPRRPYSALADPADRGGAPRELEPPPSVIGRLGGALLVLIASYTLYAGIWAVLYLVMFGQMGPAVQLGFVMFAAPPGFLALMMRWPFVGGFLGGAMPLSLFALYHSPEFIRNTPGSPPPLAWFVVFFLIGGMIGALTAGPMVTAARSIKVPLPRNYQRVEHINI